MKNSIIASSLTIFICISCQNTEYQCKDIYPEEKFSSRGYIFYFGQSQDGMGDFWFFPVCDSKTNWKQNHILKNTYKKGIAFKLPLTGAEYKHISKSFKTMDLDENSFSKKIWYVPVFIMAKKTKKSIITLPVKNENLNIKLKLKNAQLSLSYFIADEIIIEQLTVEAE